MRKVGRARIVAAVVHKGRIVSLASNSYKTHPMQKKLSGSEHKVTLHAEVDALIKAIKILDTYKLSKSTLYVVRAKYDAEKRIMIPGNATPCPICQTLINEFNIKVIHT